jgi:hypothetical protein
MEIELGGGWCVRVDRDVDAVALGRVRRTPDPLPWAFSLR